MLSGKRLINLLCVANCTLAVILYRETLWPSEGTVPFNQRETHVFILFYNIFENRFQSWRVAIVVCDTTTGSLPDKKNCISLRRSSTRCLIFIFLPIYDKKCKFSRFPRLKFDQLNEVYLNIIFYYSPLHKKLLFSSLTPFKFLT